MAIQSLRMTARIDAVEVGANDFGGPAFNLMFDHVIDLTNGTGASQADILWVDERTVGSASNDDIDLAGVLTNAFGATVTAVELVGIFISNKPTTGANTTNLTIGAATNPITGFMGGTTPTIGPVRPNSFVFLGASDAAGFGAVTAGTGDILRVANSSGASATYRIAIIARTA